MLYFFKNSMFKHSYRDGVDPLRSALKKKVDIESFIEFRRNRIYFVQNQCSIASLRGGGFACARARAYLFRQSVLDRAARGSNPVRFLLKSCCVYPTWLGRRATPRNNNNTIPSCRGPRAIIAPRAVRLILSRIPLSDSRDMSGVYPPLSYPRTGGPYGQREGDTRKD